MTAFGTDVLDKVTPEWLGEPLGSDVRSSLDRGARAAVVFEVGGTADDQFRRGVRRAIGAIEAKDAKGLLPRFLTVGPYVDSGRIPRGQRDGYLNDEEVAAVIRFIHSSAINTFQGTLAELLAVGPVCDVVDRLAFGTDARVYAGDSVMAKKPSRQDWGKAADFHILRFDGSEARVLGVVEVKSYVCSAARLRPQLDQHARRPRRGLRLLGHEVAAGCVVTASAGPAIVKVSVVPSDWRLSRGVRFEVTHGRTILAQPSATPPRSGNRVQRISPRTWHVTLRWSQEALAAAAYDLTFWYMGVLGEWLWSQARPKGWERLTPDEAGQNATKMMLYYAILRARSVREKSRAIALYNSYSFGYSLGANFVDRSGRRCMLWPEDLREIADSANASGPDMGRARTQPVQVKDRLGRVVKVLPPPLCRIRA